MADIIKLDGTRPLDFDRETVEQAYDRWAPVYDLVFGGVFSKGRKAAFQATNKIGGRGRCFVRSASAAPGAAGRAMRHGWPARAASNWRSAAWCRRSAISPWCVSVKPASPRLPDAQRLLLRHRVAASRHMSTS